MTDRLESIDVNQEKNRGGNQQRNKTAHKNKRAMDLFGLRTSCLGKVAMFDFLNFAVGLKR
jgi:hypothetical protein